MALLYLMVETRRGYARFKKRINQLFYWKNCRNEKHQVYVRDFVTFRELATGHKQGKILPKVLSLSTGEIPKLKGKSYS